jgi:hypothetical protein
MLGIATLGLLGAAVAKASGAKPGDVLAEGEAQGGDGQLYQWRVIKSYPGAEYAYSGMAKLAGFGQWVADTIVAMGPNQGSTKDLVLTYLSELTQA